MRSGKLPITLTASIFEFSIDRTRGRVQRTMNDLKKFSKGVSADFFRDALKYIDFPPEDFEPGEESGKELFDSSSQTLPPPVTGVTTSLPSEFSGGDFGNNVSDRKPSIAVNLPAAVSAIENFFSRNIPLQKLSTNATNAGCLFTEHLPADPVDCPPGFLRVTSSKDVSALESESQISQISAKKKMESARELNSPSAVAVTKQSRGVRTCLHCGSISTPQWRNGPTGQTLCNACWMRNRSGKLAPAPCPRAGSTRSSQVFKSPESEFHISKTLVKNKPRKQMKLNSPSVIKQSQGTKTCLHCGSAKTPQWRNGPMGPKTLCNACGVRYKSGGLTAEYLPKASPMFDPSLHSNFRRKVKGLQNNLEVDQTQQPPLGS